MVFSEELLNMITRCGLNCLSQFTASLSHHLWNSKTNPKLLQVLVQLNEVQHGGLSLGREEEAWAIQNGINLRVNIFDCCASATVDNAFPFNPESFQTTFGCTEASVILTSVNGKGQDASFLAPLEGMPYNFFPIESNNELSTSTATCQDSSGSLLELVILSELGDCPDVSLQHVDGHYHTGDLFVEVEPGKYLSHG